MAMALYRTQLFSSLVILPIANALGHLAPALGASWAAVGIRIWDYHTLILLFAVHTLLDSYDKYRDIPSHSRPLDSTWMLWSGSLILLIAWAAFETGYSSAIRIIWYLGLEVFWAGKLIPIYSFKKGLRFVKLRQLFGPGKSLFCGIMAGLMDAAPLTHHACLRHPRRCAYSDQRFRSHAYSVLYNFVRETVYDARDITEDKSEGVTTLATTLGMMGTMLALAVAVVVGELWIGGAGMPLSRPAMRCAATVASSMLIARQPRENSKVWASFALLSLVPAWHAQAQNAGVI